MFDIELQTNASATNVLDKKLTLQNTVSGVLRKGCSIIDPVIIIHTDGSDVWRESFNYFHIPAFNRYYYLTNMVAVEGSANLPGITNPSQLWEIHGHVDVLMSYSKYIKAQTAIVARQENKYNLMLDDGFFMTYQNPKIQTKLFSVEGPFEHQEFVLVVAGS